MHRFLSRYYTQTRNAPVADFKIRGQVFRTGLDEIPQGRHAELAPAPAGAGTIQYIKYADGAAEIAVVPRDATTHLVTSIARLLHDDHVTGRAGRVEEFELTVLPTIWGRISYQKR